MIALRELTADIARYLTLQTGTAAFCQRVSSAVYPCLTVEAAGKSAGIIACGRQVERQVMVTVTCWPSRQRGREEGLELADGVYGALVSGFCACGRGFCPREAEIRIDEQECCRVVFLLEFCDTPDVRKSESPVAETMGALSLRLEQEMEGS